MELSKYFPSMVSILVTGAVASGLTILLGKVFKRAKKPTVECLLFSPYDIHCLSSSIDCTKMTCPLCNFEKICALLRATQYKLDICMYLITQYDLSQTVLRLHKRGVRVRVILDRHMSEEAHKSKMSILFKNKIPFKFCEAKFMMHNKFFLIDDEIVVTGSCNWTYQGFSNNHENLVIVRDKTVFKQYNRYFEDLWLRNKIRK